MNTLLSKVLLPLGLLILALATMSNSGGRAASGNSAATLAPGDGTTTCASSFCHGTNSYDPSMSVEVSDTDGNLVTEYTLDQTYTVKVTIDAGSGTPIGYGFQVVSLDGEDNNYNAWGSNLPGGTQISELSNGRQYFEQTNALPTNSFEIEWTAPAEVQGDMTFYAAGLAVNGNGNTGGDGGTSTTFTLSAPVMSNVDDTFVKTNLLLYPNPTTQILNLDSEWTQGQVEVYNHAGKLQITFENIPSQILTDQLSPGLYILRIVNGEQSITQKFNKI